MIAAWGRAVADRIAPAHGLLILAALIVYLPGFGWGVPDAAAADRVHSWGVDATLPLGPLSEMHNIIEPKPDRNLGYPLMSYFLVFAAYLPYLGWLWLTGALSGISGVYPFGLSDPAHQLQALALIGIGVSTVMAVGIVLAAYEAARALWDHATGLLCGSMTALCYPIVYYSRAGNPDVPMLFFIALALAVFARGLSGGFTLRRTIWLGLWIGFAMATKEPALASFLAVPFVVLFHRREGQGHWRRWTFWRIPLAGAAAALLSFGAGSGLFIDPQRYFAHIQFGRERVSALTSGQIHFVQPAPNTWEGNLQLLGQLAGALADSMTWPGLLLAVAGLLWCAMRELRQAVFALSALTYLATLLSGARVVQLRYVMPAAFVLAFFAARGMIVAWRSGMPWLRWSAAAWGLLGIGLGAAHAADLNHAMLRDSRYAAARWLASRTQPGDRVETFGPIANLPPLKAGVVSAQSIQFFGLMKPPRLDPTAVEEILAAWKRHRPKFVLIQPDYTSRGAPFSASCPPQIYDGLILGRYGYRLAMVFHTPSLLPWAARPPLDYPVVNPPIRIFARVEEPGS